MPEFFWTAEFWFGAMALCVFQFGKFNELSSADPAFLRLSHPNLRASDFAGPQIFAGALVLFIAVTLVIYFILCWASPTVLIGVANVTQTQPEQFSQFIGSVPYPLYIAAGFMGFAQQAVPGLSKIGNIQRDVFHRLLGVPLSAIRLVDAASAQLFAQGADREQLSRKVEALVGNAWLASMHRYADLSFYRAEIERLKLGSAGEREEAKNGSVRELQSLFEKLIYAAAIATIRTSGKRGLRLLATDLAIPPEATRPGFAGALRTGVVCYLLGLTFLIFGVPMIYPAIDMIAVSGTPKYWPLTVNASGSYVLSQVAPVLISTMLLMAFVPLGRSRDVPTERRTAMGLLNRHAGFVLLVIAAVVTFDYVQALFDFGFYKKQYDGRLFDFITAWFPFNVLHSFISVTACLIIIWHFNASDGERPEGIRPALSSIVGLVGTVALFYAAARMVFLDKAGLPLDYIALIAVLNIFAAAIAFFAVLSVKRRAVDMPLAAAE